MQRILTTLFTQDYDKNFGVRKIYIYLLRVQYILILVNVGKSSWGYILNYQGNWEPFAAAAWCMWAAFSCLSFIGILFPLKMLPLLIFEIIYKLLWLWLVAYPLWSNGLLFASPASGLANAFLWVAFTIAVTPWGYVYNSYFSGFLQLPTFLKKESTWDL